LCKLKKILSSNVQTFLIKVYIHISLCLELPSRNKWFLCVCAHVHVLCECVIFVCIYTKQKKLYLSQLNECYIHKCVYRELTFIHNFHISFTVPLEVFQGNFCLKINMIKTAWEYQALQKNGSHFEYSDIKVAWSVLMLATRWTVRGRKFSLHHYIETSSGACLAPTP
jgi:hypothetical protein